jgi:hypothetical protein
MMDFITEIFEPVEVVMEMTADQGRLVPLAPEFLQSVIGNDAEPIFGTYVIESGWSKSKRFWGPELFGGVASEINTAATTEPIVGYLGHIKPDNDPYEFPPIQLQWVGAKLLQAGEKAKLAVKAYFLPGTQARDYAKRRLAKAVSWRGKIAQERFEQGVRVKAFHIESIDLARPRSAGMSAQLVALTSEMDEGRNDEVKPEEIAALSANELRAHNSTLVTSIETEARQPLETKVGEMESAEAAIKPTLDLIPDLRKLLGMKDDAEPLAVLSAAISQLRETGKTLRDSVLDTVLGKKLKGGDEADRKLVRKLIVGEMRGRDFTLTGDSAKDEKTVEEMVNEIINSDDDLKATVSEMEGAPVSPPVSSNDDNRNSAQEVKAGYKSKGLRVRAKA